jgi:1,2-diacylglycerol 3-alpha-glucosyltransferase
MMWIVPIIFIAAFLYFYNNEIRVKAVVSKALKPKLINVGIVSDWHRKGVPYQSRFLSKCLGDKFNVHIFAYHEYVKDEADYGYKKLVFTRLIKPWKVISWIKMNGLKVVFFPDRLEDEAVLDWCKKNKVATIDIINYETIKEKEFAHIKKNTVLMCPVKCTFDLLKQNGFKNIKFIRWGIDNDVYKPSKTGKKLPIRFIHNAGFGGTEWRKNTLAVVEAFNKACRSDPDIKLVLKSQKPISEYPETLRYILKKNKNIIVNDKDLKMSELIKLYRSCHVSLLPSKWEGIGIPFIESLALGLPVLTVDAPPMNEWVKDGYNGYTAKVSSWESRRDKELIVKGALVNIDDYADIIVKATDQRLLKKLSANAAKSVRTIKKDFTKETVKLTRSLCKK